MSRSPVIPAAVTAVAVALSLGIAPAADAGWRIAGPPRPRVCLGFLVVTLPRAGHRTGHWT